MVYINTKATGEGRQLVAVCDRAHMIPIGDLQVNDTR